MIERLKTNWEEFQESEPGERFKDRYNRRRQDEEGHLLKRILLIALGTVIAISSLALAPLPGPGWGTVFIGLMILGGELLPAARLLDWAEVIGLASEPNHDWLSEHGVTPVAYGEGQADRIREASGGEVDAFIDTYGSAYVELALELGVRPERVNTIADFSAPLKHGVKAYGGMDAASAGVMAGLAAMISAGTLDVPIARTYPLSEVREAYRELERRHTRGKIVLLP